MDIRVEMGGHLKDGVLLSKPRRGRDGEKWARARIDGREYRVTEILGVWMTEAAWEMTTTKLDLIR